MNPALEKDLKAYAEELRTRGPVHNGSHHTLRRLWDTYGRDAVDQGIATLPDFQRPCRHPYTLEEHSPPVHWPAVIGKLLTALQTAGFSVDRVDDGEVTLLASGTPRQRRQQVKNVVVNSDRSHITVSVGNRKLWLCVDLDKKPCECVTDYSDDGDLEAVIKYFHSYFA